MADPDSGHQRRQRLAAYALLERGAVGGGGEILLTRLSEHVRAKGWSLPGGGVDHGEHPREALRREVYEEAGLHVVPLQLLDVYHSHFVGERPHDGVMEDFHGVGLIFAAAVLPESRDVAPHVVEVGGSTDAAAWVPLNEAWEWADSGKLSGSARLALELLRRRPGLP